MDGWMDGQFILSKHIVERNTLLFIGRNLQQNSVQYEQPSSITKSGVKKTDQKDKKNWPRYTFFSKSIILGFDSLLFSQKSDLPSFPLKIQEFINL